MHVPLGVEGGDDGLADHRHGVSSVGAAAYETWRFFVAISV